LADGTGVQVILGPIADQVASEVRDALVSGAPAAVATPLDVAALDALLRGAGARAISADATRLLVDLPAGAAIDAQALQAAGVRAVSRGARLHLILGPSAPAVLAELERNGAAS
jgi:PTS system N-acetylglucosamine-specific IIC component